MIVPNPAPLSELAALLLEEEAAARVAKAAGLARGPVTGFRDLDEELGGFLSPGIHSLLAAPGAGKTSFAAQIASRCGCPALFVSCEMRPVELLRRIVSREAGPFLQRLRGGGLSEEALTQYLETAARACPQLAVYDATAQPADGQAIQEAAEKLRARFDSRHVLVVLDSLTDWAASLAGDMTEYQANESALNALKQIAGHLACPVLMIVHRNRAGQKAEGDAQMFAGKATGRVEYVSESLWSMEHQGDKEPDQNGQTQKRLTILKNRNGVPFRALNFLFEGRRQKFEEAL